MVVKTGLFFVVLCLLFALKESNFLAFGMGTIAFFWGLALLSTEGAMK